MSGISNIVTVLITGGNRGIGFEAAKILVQSSNPTYHVFIGSRDHKKGQEAASILNSISGPGSATAIQLDVESDESVQQAASNFTHSKLDILINNAGIGSQHSNTVPLLEAMQQVFSVNLFGAVRVTEAFLPILNRSPNPKLIFVSSTTGSMTIAAAPGGPLSHGGVMDYRSSKAALNMVTTLYWNILREGGKWRVWGCNPGLIATEFHGKGRECGEEPGVGGRRIVRVVEMEGVEDCGKIIDKNGGILPW